jgi:hypothetical protein
MALDDNDDFVAFFEKYKGLSGSHIRKFLRADNSVSLRGVKFP